MAKALTQELGFSPLKLSMVMNWYQEIHIANVSFPWIVLQLYSTFFLFCISDSDCTISSLHRIAGCSNSNVSTTSSSRVSIWSQVSEVYGYFITLKTLNITRSLSTRRIIFPSYTSISTLPVVKNGLPKIRENFESTSISKIMKSAVKMNLSTLINTSSMILFDLLM